MHERDQYLKQVDRLVASRALRGSESLCRLLQYLAAWALEHPGEHPKEYQIATEAFGRPPDFDPRVDSTIRVQAGRLRQKLAEYYAGEGAEDPILIDLPKGSYALSFEPRSQPRAHTGELPPANVQDHEAAPARRGPAVSITAFTISTVLVAAVALFIGFSISRSEHRQAQARTDKPAPAALQLFWKPFLTGTQDPLVVYSNALFVGRPETGLRYYHRSRDAGDHIFDQYTGVGEVMAVHDLDRMFQLFGRHMVVKRGELFTLDDAQNNNLIFVGSPSENLTLQVIPGTEEFVFHRLTDGPRKGDLAILNVHPDAGEQKTFLASPANVPMTHDYAVIALMRGLNPTHWVVILAGTTTFGTQGAVEYVCRESFVRDLLLRLSVAPTGELEPFEALLKVNIANGVPLDEHLVAVRERPSGKN
jgi:hypothetical protein